MNRRKNTLYIVLIVALILLFVVSFLFLNSVRRLHRAGVFHPIPHFPHMMATSTNVASIQPWMTFNYISMVFAVPTDYLKTNLSITSSRYPRISIEETAEEKNTLESLFLDSVKQSVSQYLLSHNATTTNGIAH